MIVARPRAVPMPLPLIAFGPTRLNLMDLYLASSCLMKALGLTLAHFVAYQER